MSSRIRVELDRKGVRELLRSEEMRAVCEEHAQNALKKLGDGYEADSYTGKSRVNVSVRTKTAEAVRDNYKNNTLLKAVGGK